jgi:hypothetical protein
MCRRSRLLCEQKHPDIAPIVSRLFVTRCLGGRLFLLNELLKNLLQNYIL